jgi:hypothetical protein
MLPSKKVIAEFEEEFRRRYGEVSLIVALLGAGGKGLDLRRKIKKKLKQEGIIGIVPEDDFTPDVAQDLIERSMLRKSDVKLVFINVESWGSATEFGQFQTDEKIAPKLRVLVDYRHHPLHGGSRSYLSSAYLTHAAVYGHVYPYKESGGYPFLTVDEVVLKLAKRYKEWKVLGKRIFTR